VTTKVKDPASALGEAVGKLVEDAVHVIVEEIIKECRYEISDVKELTDKAGIKFKIDLPIKRGRDLVALVDVKYLRYTKHARDKGSWVIVAHNRLRASYPTIKKCIVILAGHGWSADAKRMIKTSCIDVIDATPEVLNGILRRHGVEFVWKEKDEETPKKSWEKWQSISEEEKLQIKSEIMDALKLKERLRKALIDIGNPQNNEYMKLDYICKEKLSTLNRFTS
jgi:hypothetical protein